MPAQIDFLVIRYMTIEGSTLLNQYGFTLDLTVLNGKLMEKNVRIAMKQNRILRNSVLLLREYLTVALPDYRIENALWATPGIDDIGVSALWTLGIHTPDDIKSVVSEASNNNENLVQLTRRLYREALAELSLTPDTQRAVWAGILSALSYWSNVEPTDVIGPSSGMRP